jgi:hypothetical protein
MTEGNFDGASQVSQGRVDKRAALLRSRPPKKEPVTFDGMALEIWQPKLTGRQKLINDSQREDGTLDSTKLSVLSAIICTHDPDTGQRIFEDADYEVLMDQYGDFIDTITPLVTKLITPDVTPGKDESGSAKTEDTEASST